MKKINMNYTTNEQLWSIEDLKADGWRWHSAKKCWYNRNTEQHLQALRAATEIDALPA